MHRYQIVETNAFNSKLGDTEIFPDDNWLSEFSSEKNEVNLKSFSKVFGLFFIVHVLLV